MYEHKWYRRRKKKKQESDVDAHLRGLFLKTERD